MKTGINAVSSILCGALLLIGGLAFGVRANAAVDSNSTPANLNEQVRHRLVMLPWYGVFDNITYQVNGNEVVLNGEVVNDVNKRDAQATIKNIPGVHVIDNIKVLPASIFDDQTRRAEYRSIFGMPRLSQYAAPVVPTIHIIVDKGHVTLEGTVATKTDKEAATIAADRVPDVFSVTNNLKIVAGS